MDRHTTLSMGIDPGAEYVGVAMGRGAKDINLATYIWSPEQFLDQFEGTTVRRISIERFDMRQFTLESMATVKLIGVIEYLCRKRRISIGYVNASDKRKFIRQAQEDHRAIRSHALDAEAIRRYDVVYGTW